MPLSQRLWRLTLACWLILAVAVGVRTFVRPAKHTVFPVFAEGSRHWWTGQSLYEPSPGIDLFRYSPTFAVMMTPFAALDDRSGGILWSWLNLAVFFLGLRGLARAATPAWPPSFEPLLLLLALIGGLYPIWNGQSNPLLTGLLLLGSAAVVRRQWWPAAWLFSIAVAVKLPVLAVALLFAALYPRPLAGRLSVALLAGLALPFLTQAPGVVVQTYQEWGAQLLNTSGLRWPGYRDAWTVWELFESPVHVPTYRALQLLSAVAILAWCLWFRQRAESSGQLAIATLGMGTTWLMLFGPATEFATYILLAPTVSWATLESWRLRQRLPLALAAYLLTMVIGSGRFTSWYGPWARLDLLVLPLGSVLHAVWWLGARKNPGGDEPPGGPYLVREASLRVLPHWR